SLDTDPERVKQLLLECARMQKGIMKTPEPFVLLEEFAESALIFGVYFFVNDSFVDPKIKSQLRFRIISKFREYNIRSPFPQRDVHFVQKLDTLKKDGDE